MLYLILVIWIRFQFEHNTLCYNCPYCHADVEDIETHMPGFLKASIYVLFHYWDSHACILEGWDSHAWIVEG